MQDIIKQSIENAVRDLYVGDDNCEAFLNALLVRLGLQTPTSRGKTSFKNGIRYQHEIARKINNIYLRGEIYPVEEVDGAEAGSDIRWYTPVGVIGIEVKNAGAFEGGSSKMEYDPVQGRLVFPAKSPLHQHCLGDNRIYGGKNLPHYEGRRTLDDTFREDIRMPISNTTMCQYYKRKGTHYIAIQGFGIYHTGDDILGLGVPLFECEQTLRIRTSKHKKNGMPTDVVGDINYDKNSLVKSPYNFDADGKLPLCMSMRAE